MSNGSKTPALGDLAAVSPKHTVHQITLALLA